MTAEIIDGTTIAGEILTELRPRVEALRARGVAPEMNESDPPSATATRTFSRGRFLAIHSSCRGKPMATSRTSGGTALIASITASVSRPRK